MRVIYIRIVTCVPIARHRLGKHIPARANARKNRLSIARQPKSKQSSLTTVAVFSVRLVQNGYKKVLGNTVWKELEWSEESSFETPSCRDMSLGAVGLK
jgi:hypothetical protein